MDFVSRYTAHQPDKDGFVAYSEAEHQVWEKLYTRQIKVIQNRAADEYLAGIEKLGYCADRIPQIPELSAKLQKLTGWQVVPVAALISARAFFELLAARRFPGATFIRSMAHLDYVQEPDIFHELFGHCPLLTDPVFADFVSEYAQCVLKFPESDWPLLQRLFWFTVEFGLIETTKGLRIYGGGILSSVNETAYSLDSHVPMRVFFDPITAFRTPYRIDEMQTVYFVIKDYQQLYNMLSESLADCMHEARKLGEYPPLFAIEEPSNPSIHIYAC